MSPCLRCMISRGLKLKRPSPQLLFRTQRIPRTLSSQSLFSPPEVFPARSAGRPASQNQRRGLSSTTQKSADSSEKLLDNLPICCPGCGAYSQTVEPNEPGYYGKPRKQTRKLLSGTQKTTEAAESDNGSPDEAKDTKYEGERVTAAIRQLNKASEEKVGAPKPQHGALLENTAATASNYIEKSTFSVHICDRCHDLMHHNKAVSAPSPTIHSIREFLDESPHTNNRIYHVLDAADFPMSLVPGIYKALSIQEQRSHNRRSSTEKYRGGRKLPTITFVITRSDLLAATKDQVDSKMEYMRSVLRETLGRSVEDNRMGNVHMVSAHRGWWTKKVKEEIREHGGGVWVVGKANVGKSSFIEACFPKDSKNLEKMAELIERRQEESRVNQHATPILDPDSLLPPAPREDLYPVLPVVSSLPGTTVSPIRIPFGRGKGEMIDLPGLDRGQLEDYVRDEYKRDLIMTKRGTPERFTIKPGQSLLLGGGLLRITPTDPDLVVMAASFLPLESHITKTEKAIEMQVEKRAYRGKTIMKEGTGGVISSAGTFDLKWDVTRSHLPTAIAKAVEDRGVKIPPLPYKVMSADILIEGCGWVELTAQIRSDSRSDKTEPPRSLPQVEVFSPNGKHVGSRFPIECWEFIAQKQASDNRKRGPRGRQNAGHNRRIQASKI
ncbi:hypothetical protein ASPWEDRAFT_166395 [Aspergillus wentii DTO 134E9]|uniref:G domain-containing protein n=1 Tax=Aspergillus wentii DTO 134E9 TaxID=1073089 RepID=A0A1L9RZH6_ASPWE|nr:uncharacterized protein ASPWEDRAFT_166395 [Aspergillus wentii DTO 134E9]OJJ40315.1 hypothetical protein ASPWEDRAFT_166395 [Aspergillus wentii DTO 134E9]